MRITVGDRQRSFTGAWVLAALLVLGHNGLNLTNLLDQPLLGNSEEIKGIRGQWKLLEQLGSLAIREATAVAEVDLDRVFSRFEPLSVLDVWDSGPAPEKKVKAKRGPVLPHLTGVLSISDGSGKVHSIAIFDGKRFLEKDRVRGFTIEKITEEGVTLTKWGTKWFVPASESAFSLVWKD